MTVKELIEVLKTKDQDAQVAWAGSEWEVTQAEAPRQGTVRLMIDDDGEDLETTRTCKVVYLNTD